MCVCVRKIWLMKFRELVKQSSLYKNVVSVSDAGTCNSEDSQEGKITGRLESTSMKSWNPIRTD